MPSPAQPSSTTVLPQQNEKKANLCDELDTDVESGSGYISICGPPGSGKTTLVLEYLTSREKRLHGMKRSFLLEYVAGRAVDGDVLQRFARRLRPQGKRRRTECSLLQFSTLVRQWLDSAVEGSEIHFVLDDADDVKEETSTIDRWLSMCLGDWQGRRNSNIVCLWIVSQMPMNLSSCFRYHFIPRPEAHEICDWLDAMFTKNRVLFEDEMETDVPHLALEQAHATVKEAVLYYTTHLPMQSSIVARDIRQLLQRVQKVLPFLVQQDTAVRLNAMHLATAWGKWREAASPQALPPSSSGAGTVGLRKRLDPLVSVLKKIGYSAMLWALSAFYCGAVPKSKHARVFGARELQQRTSTTESSSASHKAAVLSSLAHVVRLPRLMLVYRALLDMCVNHIDHLEFAPAELAVQHNHTLVSWGLMVPTSQGTKGYHCHIPVTSAVALSQHLSLSLYDLIPQ
ncbi:AAA domain [Trypanosoma vivax]|uniref:ORC1/DEAH AAA+ ATPase domain-containing protein n=1 Tax=Trypanosoma vivax (strain Y486) TaxID=1055687 RepID=G0U781_TRYVY|nr:hypothetical protein TRVL_06843 [Trypanosoma vivax]KAH8620649.1 AAA domain [Trypanosoma vivax]CCC51738.1 conserved hypothetical protein [Trypanosoma vivax Y486]